MYPIPPYLFRILGWRVMSSVPFVNYRLYSEISLLYSDVIDIQMAALRALGVCEEWIDTTLVAQPRVPWKKNELKLEQVHFCLVTEVWNGILNMNLFVMFLITEWRSSVSSL